MNGSRSLMPAACPTPRRNVPPTTLGQLATPETEGTRLRSVKPALSSTGSDGWAGFASRKNPGRAAGGDGLGRHRFGSGSRGGFGLGGRRAGLGDAGNEALGQLDRTLHGAAGVGADVLVGREGDHEVEDAPGWIAGSDGYGWGCCYVVVLICRAHVSYLFRALRPFTKKRGDCGRPVGVVFRGHHLSRPPHQSRAVKGEGTGTRMNTTTPTTMERDQRSRSTMQSWGVFRGWPHGQGVRGLTRNWMRVGG